MELPGGFDFPLEAHNKLLVRNAHKHLWTLFEKCILNEGGKKIDGVKYRAMLILGQEGTGKVNVFLYCILFCLLFYRYRYNSDKFFAFF
jgi:hypothetical protein